MMRGMTIAALAAMAVAACEPMQQQSRAMGPDGRPLPTLYRVSSMDPSRVQFRMLDSVNALRKARGLPELELSAELNAAAMAHSRDMSFQDRPWNFGSDGSSPLDRVARAGFTGRLVGENVSETFESEVEALGAWMEEPATSGIIMAPEARFLGLGWHQDANGKIWWTQLIGA
ncbi:MAG: CAP domain-containing protein [Rhodobacteraceae bacterium]|nr:CAP domain-containing protein [Paracoccaceae bacterium]